MTPRRIALAIATAAIVAATLSGAASGCESQKGGTGEGGTTQGHILKACDTKIKKKASRVGHGLTIEAETKSVCDVTPLRHVVFVTIAYHPTNSGTYVTMGTKYCEAKPVPGIPTDCHVTLPGACRVGVWRVTVNITGTGPNGNPFALTLPDRPTSKIKSCDY